MIPALGRREDKQFKASLCHRRQSKHRKEETETKMERPLRSFYQQLVSDKVEKFENKTTFFFFSKREVFINLWELKKMMFGKWQTCILTYLFGNLKEKEFLEYL